MGVLTIISIVLVIAAVAFILARGRSVALVQGATEKLHSRPGYYGSYALIWASIPALLLLALWNVVSPIYVDNSVRGTFPQEIQDIVEGLVGKVQQDVAVMDRRKD